MTKFIGYILPIIAGALSTLALAPLEFWPVMFITMPLLLWSIKRADNGSGKCHSDVFAVGWLFGLGYFGVGLSWIGAFFQIKGGAMLWLMPFALFAISASLALFYGMATALAYFVSTPGHTRTFSLALTFVIAEWLRANLLGFPWNPIGITLASSNALLQTVSIFGIHGLTFIVVLLCASPALLISPNNTGFRTQMAMTILFIVIYQAGLFRLNSVQPKFVTDVRLRLVQPGFSVNERFGDIRRHDILQHTIDLSRHNSTGKRDDLLGITHLLWPEFSLPFQPLQNKKMQEKLATLLPKNVLLLAGGVRYNSPKSKTTLRQKHNSLFIINDQGHIIGMKDKQKLVPFGEYIPFSSLLQAVGINLKGFTTTFHPGKQSQSIIKIAGLPYTKIQICYELLFSSGEAITGKQKPAMILNPVFDGWLGQTSGPYQHLQHAKIKATEAGIPIIRPAYNGISAVIDAYGRVIKTMPMGFSGVMDTALPIATPMTIYGHYGLLPISLLFFSFFLWLWIYANAHKSLPFCKNIRQHL